jgi:hypothetical protein
MEQHYINRPWPCRHHGYNIADFAQDILDGRIPAYTKDANGELKNYESGPARLSASLATTMIKIEKGELYFYKADLMMLDRDTYKFKLLDLEPRIEEKNALIEKLKHRVAFLESYTDDEEMRVNRLLQSFGIAPETGTSAQPQEQTAAEVSAPGTKRGEMGRQKANLQKVADWKEVYLPAMIKAAVEIGAQGPQGGGAGQRQRKDVQGVLDKYLEGVKCPKAVLDTLYKALPNNYVDRQGGNSPMKPKIAH